MDAVMLSPWALFVQAGIVVKGVMILLVIASIWCWTTILEALVVLRRIDRALRKEIGGNQNARTILSPLFAAAANVRPGPRETAQDTRRRIAATMTRSARVILADAERGLPNLAIISSVAPFIGLFGTVWGIMTSFAGIAEAKETSLAIVAPGIAEALAATAYGLAAAIPASVAYNRIGAAFARRGLKLMTLIEDRADAMTTADPLHIAAE